MNRGDGFPRARARWQDSRLETGRPGAPSWIDMTTGVFSFLDLNDSDLPLRVVTWFDTNPGQWRYRTRGGQIIWRGTWDTADNSGFWFLSQRSAGADGARFNFGWFYEFAASFVGVVYNSIGTGWQYGWTYNQEAGIPLTNRVSGPLSVLGADDVKFTPMSYRAIRDIGEDPDDTAPVTWDF